MQGQFGEFWDICLDMSGSHLVNGCDGWNEEFGLYLADNRELRRVLEQRGKIMRAAAQSDNLDIQKEVWRQRGQGGKGPARERSWGLSLGGTLGSDIRQEAGDGAGRRPAFSAQSTVQ